MIKIKYATEVTWAAPERRTEPVGINLLSPEGGRRFQGRGPVLVTLLNIAGKPVSWFTGCGYSFQMAVRDSREAWKTMRLKGALPGTCYPAMAGTGPGKKLQCWY